MKITIKIAECIIDVHYQYEYMAQICSGFTVAEGSPDFVVETNQQEILQEYEENQGKFNYPLCEATCLHRKISLKLLEYNTFIMHASVVQVDGQGYGFMAHSGVGKTTHTRLWLQKFGSRASVVNGDKPMIAYRNGTFYAYGTPWRGKEGMGENAFVPLKGLAFLERGEENSIEIAQWSQVVRHIFDQILVPKTPVELSKQVELLDTLLKTVPIYKLQCNMLPQAADVAFARMSEGIV